jgi:hypothetical protein
MSVEGMQKIFNDNVKNLMTQAAIGACCLTRKVTITFYGKLRKPRYCERISSH